METQNTIQIAGTMEFDKLANKKGLKLVHLNIRSLIGKIDQPRVNLTAQKNINYNLIRNMVDAGESNKYVGYN